MAHWNQNENQLLARIAQAFDQKQGSKNRFLKLGIGDDAALYAPRAGCETILSCDWFLEDTHFLRKKHPADAIGWKCLARAVSDIAAMGGVPRCFLLSMALPSNHIGRWLDKFLRGLQRSSRQFGCPLAGGDTTQTEQILINVSVIGEVRRGRAILRSGARAGDLIYVTGRLGEAELGLRLLRNPKAKARKKDPSLRKHLYPEPRLRLGQWLAKKQIASAMMDLSDGLSSDLPRMCAASGVGARIEEGKLPTARPPAYFARSGVDPLKLALHGGDDYELLFTVPKAKTRLLRRSLEGVMLTQIGEVTRRKKIALEHADGRTEMLIPGGWDPFRRRRKHV
jgi:thiamine-monophosphate kinase